MANECGIGGFQDVLVEEEEDEVELSLGLSIGRSFRKLEKLKPIKPKRVCSSSMNDAKSGEIDMKFGENDGSFCRSSFSPILNAGFSSVEANESNGVAEIMDSKRKREIHALRRQEARKKREEKRQKKGIYSAKNNGIYVNGSNLPMRTGSIDDKIMLEAQVFQFRVKDREVKENQASRSGGISKKEKPENQRSGDEKQDTNPSLEDKETLNQKPNKSNPSTMSSLPLPVAPVQYIPFANGFSFPCVMPCLVPLSAASGDDKNVFHPIAQRSFKPFFQVQNPNVNRNCSDLEQNGNSGGRIKPKESSLASCGSSGSSSANSDHQSTYLQGGSSRETRSHSSNSEEESKQSPSCHHGSSHQGVDEAINNGDNLVSSNSRHSSPKKSEESITVTESIPITKPISTSENSSSQPIFPPLMEAKGDKNKPPRPQTNHSQTMPLPRIPCVSTTGNGPNGKTINGFLYRYTKTEVSIICVCHGSSFSPAEFVEHAGGTDILNPLKHIVVVPSALG